MRIVTEFKAFIQRGNVVDLSIAVVMGGAFNAIVNSLVADLIMPLLSVITLGTDFSALMIPIGTGANAANLTYGNLIAAIIKFMFIAIVIFTMVKALNRFANQRIGEAPPSQTCPYCASRISDKALRCPNCTTVLDEKQVPMALR
jgi:large conductance mechanosensitive channel